MFHSIVYFPWGGAVLDSKHVIIYHKYLPGGVRWHSWLRHYAASQEVACLIPDGVT
jgi:hypothetical protein